MRLPHVLVHVLMALWLIVGSATASPLNPYFVDRFDYSGAPRAPWVVKNAAAEVGGGHMRLQSTTSPRDTLVTAFDDSLDLRNYRFSAAIDPVEGLNHTWAVLVFRAQNFNASDLGSVGNAYQLLFSDNIGTTAAPLRGNGQADFVELYKYKDGVSTRLFAQFVSGLGSAFTAGITGRGGNLSVDVNGQNLFQVKDMTPILAGGVGLRTIWEAATNFDDVVVATVPLPMAGSVLLASLGGLAALRIRTRRRTHS